MNAINLYTVRNLYAMAEKNCYLDQNHKVQSVDPFELFWRTILSCFCLADSAETVCLRASFSAVVQHMNHPGVEKVSAKMKDFFSKITLDMVQQATSSDFRNWYDNALAVEPGYTQICANTPESIVENLSELFRHSIYPLEELPLYDQGKPVLYYIQGNQVWHPEYEKMTAPVMVFISGVDQLPGIVIKVQSVIDNRQELIVLAQNDIIKYGDRHLGICHTISNWVEYTGRLETSPQFFKSQIITGNDPIKKCDFRSFLNNGQGFDNRDVEWRILA